MKLFVAAKALVENDAGELLIVREAGTYDEGTNIGKWDVVGGRLEEGEVLLEGLAREVKEESGLEGKVVGVIDVNDKLQEIKGELVHIVRVYYHVKVTDDTVVLSDDHDKYEWIAPHAYGEFGLITDVSEVFERLNK